MSTVTIAVLTVACLVLAVLLLREERRRRHVIASPKRIVFPFVGQRLSDRTLAAALRLAQAEHATLVPAYLALVPLQLPLDTPLPLECAAALPLLEAIEQRSAAQHVAVDARIVAGRTYRHALTRLFEQERFDRVVVAAGTERTEGFSAGDIAWLLEHAPGEVVALRPEPERRIAGRRPSDRTDGHRAGRRRQSHAAAAARR